MIKLDAIKKIGIVGAGTMGQGIAQVCATAGYTVVLYDIEPAITEKAYQRIEKSFSKAVEKGKLSKEEKEEAIKRIGLTNSIERVLADLIIEAAIERVDIKLQIFSELEKINSEDTVFTTNTSSIPVTQIAAGLKNPERLAGLHFFNPAPIMKLVEIISGVATEPAIIDLLKDFVKKIKKTGVIAKDSPGFIVNRVARHFYVEALKVLEENVADVSTIDKLMRTTGFKMGPFELMDLIGVDTNFSVTSSMFNAFHQDGKFRPSRIQQQKVDAGHHGRKSGRGFYRYDS